MIFTAILWFLSIFAYFVNYLHFNVFRKSNRLKYDDVIKWKHFPRYWSFVRGFHRSSVNSPHKDQWRGTLMFSFICAWIKGWINNREAGDLRCHYYDVIAMGLLAIADNHDFEISHTICTATLWKTSLHMLYEIFCMNWYYKAILCYIFDEKILYPAVLTVDHCRSYPKKNEKEVSRCLEEVWKGRVTHINVSKLTIIGSDSGLSPDRCEAII